jgi:hypothetical protein
VAPTGTAFDELVAAIVAGDRRAVLRLVRASPDLVTARVHPGATRASAEDWYIPEIGHYLYGGDTALHVAAAAYLAPVIAELVKHGANVGAANRRGAQPLHYAADGRPDSMRWDPTEQRAAVVALLGAGADPNATDKSGVGPLHRAVRTRCTAAVAALLDGGADPRRPNKSGSTPLQLAHWTTGRGGSGSDAAKAEQEAIVRLLEKHGASA